MGSSQSSQPQDQASAAPQSPHEGVRMTISTRVIEQVKSAKSAEGTEARKEGGTHGKKEQSKPSPSPSPRPKAEERQAAPQRSGPRGTPSAQEQIRAFQAEPEIKEDEDVALLAAKIANVHVAVPELPKLESNLPSRVESLLKESSQKAQEDLNPLLSSIQQLSTTMMSFQGLEPFNQRAGGSDQLICNSDRIALMNCMKNNQASKCASLMEAFGACTTKYHMEQQQAKFSESRQL